MEVISPNGAIPWHDSPCAFVGSNPQCAELVQEVKKQTSMMKEVLHLLANMNGVLESVASMNDVVGRLATSMPPSSNKDVTASGIGETKIDTQAEACRVDAISEEAEKGIDTEAGYSSCESLDTEAGDTLSELQTINNFPDHHLAMIALEAFCASKTATINATDLVATTKALGFEDAFVSVVGEELSKDSVRYLFCGSTVDLDHLQFCDFDQAMKKLSRHSAGIADRENTDRVDLCSFDGRKLVERSASVDRASQASTADKISEAHTESHTQTYSMMSDRIWERRPSRFTSQSFEEVSDVVRRLGGYSVTLNTRSQVLGPLECIVIEPMGKQLGHARFVTTGVVICLHGLPPSYEVLEEWGQVLQIAKWLDMGLSVALPNLQMSAALQQEDLEAVVESTLEFLKFHRCMIVGKFWGAQRAVELAASKRLSRKVDSLILVAPSSPAPSVCGRLNMPVLLCWARDDDTASFEEVDAWIKALDDRRGPSMLQDVETAGHRFDNVLRNEAVAAAVRRFTVAGLMMSTLQKDKEFECGRTQRIIQLSRNLPEFLQLHVEKDADEDPDGSSPSCADSLWPESDEIRLINFLPQWIQAGVPTASE